MVDADEQAYADILGFYNNATFPSEKSRLLSVLSTVSDEGLLSYTLSLTLTDTIRGQDIWTLIRGVGINPNGRFLAWEFIRNNWNALVVKSGGTRIGAFIVSIAGGFSTQVSYNDVNLFFDTHIIPSGSRAKQQTLERIQGNIQWLQNNLNSVCAFLQQ